MYNHTIGHSVPELTNLSVNVSSLANLSPSFSIGLRIQHSVLPYMSDMIRFCLEVTGQEPLVYQSLTLLFLLQDIFDPFFPLLGLKRIYFVFSLRDIRVLPYCGFYKSRCNKRCFNIPNRWFDFCHTFIAHSYDNPHFSF